MTHEPASGGDADAALRVVDLEKHFGGITAVDGATFEVEAGTVTGLIGPNGAGKTTVFNVASGFLPPDAGHVYFRGTDLETLMRPSSAGRRIWTTASALTFAGLGAGVAGAVAPGASAPWAGALVGSAVGVGVYRGGDRAKRDYLGVRRTRPFQAARAGVARTFQIPRELRGMTVLENLLLAPKDQRGERLSTAWLRRSDVRAEERDLREQAVETLEFLELDHLRDDPASSLSGGQRKLLELGRVLMTDPDLVLLDEPVAGVNPTLTETLLDRIADLRDRGLTFCLVEHDMDVVARACDHVVVMAQGTVLTEGTPEEIQQDETVIEAYLGG